jgi:hypothetical protein
MSFIRQIVVRITSEHGAYILIAVIGFMASVVTLFVDVKDMISIKWLIAVACISLTVIILLFRIIIAFGERHASQEGIRVVKYFPSKRVLLIRAGFDLPVHSLLSIFIKSEGYEELYAVGYVENVQDKQVASLRIIQEYIELPSGADLATTATIKTTLPYRIFQEANL